jgi:Spy/CpxP family protein refolding chaperone
MNRRTLIALSFAILLVVLAVPFAVAAPHGRRGPDGGRAGLLGFLGHAREELNLSDQQVDQIKAIFRDLHDQNAPYREELKGGLDTITSTLLQNPSDVAGAQAQLEKQAAAERAMKANVLNATSQALNVLTAEQRARLSTMISERKMRREQRREQFRERRRG